MTEQNANTTDSTTTEATMNEHITETKISKVQNKERKCKTCIYAKEDAPGTIYCILKNKSRPINMFCNSHKQINT